jgi:hypothetical protein
VWADTIGDESRHALSEDILIDLQHIPLEKGRVKSPELFYKQILFDSPISLVRTRLSKGLNAVIQRRATLDKRLLKN